MTDAQPRQGWKPIIRDEAKRIVDFMLEANVLQTPNGNFYKRTNGLPAGLSPISIITNMFFHHHEAEFIKGLVLQKDFGSLKLFKHTMRWTDDILTLHNPNEGLLDCLVDIYPLYLTLNCEQVGKRVSYLDWSINIKPSARVGSSVSGNYTSSVHDKRFEQRFRGTLW